MPGAVAGQRLGEATQHQVPVGFEHHVDEVDDDDAADIAQPQLPDGLLGGFEVVARDGLFQVAPEPVNLPVLTSITVMASVRSMTSVPPDGSHLRSIALASCSSMRCTANTSGPSGLAGSYFVIRGSSSGRRR